MNWADRAYRTCVRDNPLAQEAELEKLANWIFTEGLLDGDITQDLRRQTYVGPAVMEYHSKSGCAGDQINSNKNRDGEVPLNPEFHFHPLDLLLSGQDAVINRASDQGTGK